MKRIFAFLNLIIFCPSISFALNPHSTYQEEAFGIYSGGGSSSSAEKIGILVVFLSLATGVYLWWSYSSPIRDWVEQNSALSFWLLIWVFPGIVMIVTGQIVK
tara:strand:- start:385 stop:693 length:309 start_codon:yes stop_codon:yes gene_type:complete